MNRTTLLLISLASAAGVLVYVSAIAWVLFSADEIFGQSSGFAAPLFLLLLFIVSATITGLLVLGKPIHLYLNGLRKDSLILLFSTLGWLILFLIAIVVVQMLQ